MRALLYSIQIWRKATRAMDHLLFEVRGKKSPSLQDKAITTTENLWNSIYRFLPTDAHKKNTDCFKKNRVFCAPTP